MTVAARPLSRVDVTGPARRRRRPSGEPPPLPRPIYRSGRVYVALTVASMLAWGAVALVPDWAGTVRQTDDAVLRWIAEGRTPVVIEGVEALGFLGSVWLWRVLRWGTLATLVLSRRTRHLLVYAGLLLGVTAVTTATRPSRPVVALGLTLVGVMYTLLPRGPTRNMAKLGTAAAMAGLVWTRLYSGLDLPSDVAVALIVGMAVPVVVFRFLVPHEAFPVVYGRRRPSVLGAARVEAVASALSSSLGWTLRDATPLRPPGSSGSTPIRLVVQQEEGSEDVAVFAKLYALAHVRSDRWYKLARAVLYGRLEDEAPFAAVRHMVEHEDYMLRLARRAGLSVPSTFGFVSLTPEREYLLVMEQFPDAAQLGPGVVTEQVVDDCLAMVRRMWDAGIAHRDIKPANVVVSGGRAHLVDLSFAEVRPSPWREAVDLAAMMLTLGLYHPAEEVYRRASTWFEPDEIGEAFAAARSVTIPAQLRTLMRRDNPGLPARFRALAPGHRPIPIQRWSVRRVALAAAVTAMAAVVATLLVLNLETAGLL